MSTARAGLHCARHELMASQTKAARLYVGMITNTDGLDPFIVLTQEDPHRRFEVQRVGAKRIHKVLSRARIATLVKTRADEI